MTPRLEALLAQLPPGPSCFLLDCDREPTWTGRCLPHQLEHDEPATYRVTP